MTLRHSLCHLRVIWLVSVRPTKNRIIKYLYQLELAKEQNHINSGMDHLVDCLHIELPPYLGLLNQSRNSLKSLQCTISMSCRN